MSMSDLKNKFCGRPWDFFLVGDFYSTQCCYIHENIGKIDSSDLFDTFNNEAAKRVRKSILDGSFKYCKGNICPHIQKNELPDKDKLTGWYKDIVNNNILEVKEIPEYIHMCNDLSCNLQCPSCRIKKISSMPTERYNLFKKFQEKLLQQIKLTKKIITINITGSGDPFASKLYRDFLFSIDGKEYPNLRIGLQTNGVMLTKKYFDRLKPIWKNIKHIMISVDAATEDTYNKIRVGGNFQQVIKNIKNISLQKAMNVLDIYLELSFIIQKENYKEMPQMVDLAVQNRYTPSFYQIYKWYESKFFDDAIIFNPKHPEFTNFIEVLKNPKLKNKEINWQNIKSYYDYANK